MPQDPKPLHWGAMDRFQAHFIVFREHPEPWELLARTKLKTQGYLGAKTVLEVSWQGPGVLAHDLNRDSELNKKIAEQSVRDATIMVEPVDDTVRIYSKWKNNLEFNITQDLFDIYNHIAYHVKTI